MCNPLIVTPSQKAQASRPLLLWPDRVGSVGALLCAVHCAVLPVAVALLPLLGLGLLASEGFERGFLVFALLIGVGSLGPSFRRHRDISGLLWLIPGLACVAAGVFIPALHVSPIAHALVMASGGLLISAAHLVNLRLVRGDRGNGFNFRHVGANPPT